MIDKTANKSEKQIEQEVRSKKGLIKAKARKIERAFNELKKTTKS